MDTAEALEAVARGYDQADGSATAFNAAVLLMGRQGQRAGGFLNELAEKGLKRVREEAELAGDVINPNTIRDIELLGTRTEQTMNRLRVSGAKGLDFAVKAWDVHKAMAREGRKQVMEAESISDAYGRIFSGTLIKAAIEAGAGAITDPIGPTPAGPRANDAAQRSARTQAILAETERLTRGRLTGQQKLRAAFESEEKRLTNAIKIEQDKRNDDAVKALQDQLEKRRQFYREDVESLRASESEKAEAIRNGLRVALEREQERDSAIFGRGTRTDSLAAVGGLVGGSRAGLGQADRQLKLQTEQVESNKRIEKLQETANEKLARIADASSEQVPI